MASVLASCAGLSPIPTISQDEPVIAQTNPEDARKVEALNKLAEAKGRGPDGVIPETRNRMPGDAKVVYGDGQFVKTANTRSSNVSSDREVELNFYEANVREVAQSVLGDMLQQNVVIDSGIDQRITLRTNHPIKKTNLILTLETTLAAAGLALVKDGDVYRVLPMAKAKGTLSKTLAIASKNSLQPGYGVTAVRLEHMSPTQMAKILEPLAPEKSILRVDDTRNILLLSASGPEMKALLETVEIFDVSPLKGMSVGYFKIRNARISQVNTELKDLIRAYSNQSGFTPPQIVPIERLNALLVFASHAENLKLVQSWILRLDQEKNEGEARIYVYRVKNRKAKELASLISSLYGTNTDNTTAQPGNDSPPDTKTADAFSNNVSTGLQDGLRSKTSFGSQTQDNTSSSRQSDSRSQQGAVETRLNNGVRIVADVDNNSLLIKAAPVEYQTILSALSRLDTVPPLVMVEVTIAEVKLNDQLKYGVEWFFKKGKSTSSFSGLDTGKILSHFPGFSYFFNAADVQVVINAVADVSKVKVLSSPKVMVMDNKTATLQIGDQVPIVTGTTQSVATTDAPIVQTVKYYDTGVILKVTPQVNSGGLITMDINQEVSNVANQGNSNSSSGSPTIQQRKINSSIAIQSGEAVVLGGLIRESKTNSSTGIPFLSSLPNVSDAFKTTDNESERTELIVIITPKVVWDRSDARDVTDDLRSKMQGVFGKR